MTDSKPAPLPYVLDRFTPRRRPTRVVHVGHVPVGGEHPIAVQSMTTTFTYDVEGTLGQIEALQRVGCDIVRVTVPALRDAEALPAIREGMRARGLTVPLVADIHFSPKMALLAVEHVEKVRINPGNFTDSKRFAVREYTDEEYRAELARIEEKFRPLVLRAKERGISMRIGTNHGSLSDRIMNRYGDTPEGMVESALEFVRICERHDYRELIISMKASNTHVMVEAYRLLAARMAEEGMDYPFHLGVTEAGDGDEARIKSAVGIGSLLADGIGDTIRVSLTEDPVAEVPVGRALAKRAHDRLTAAAQRATASTDLAEAVDFYAFARRSTRRVEQGAASAAVGGDQEVRVEVPLAPLRDTALLAGVIEELTGEEAGERRLEVAEVEVTSAEDVAALERLAAALEPLEAPPALAAALAPAVWREGALLARVLERAHRVAPIGAAGAAEIRAVAVAGAPADERALLLTADPAQGAPEDVARRLVAAAEAALAAGLPRVALRVGAGPDRSPVCWVRAVAAVCAERGLDLPLVLDANGEANGAGGEHDDGLLRAATDLGGLLIDGLGDAVCVRGVAPERAVAWGYGILQGARRRTTQTEYISCPGCGRTLFELEPVTAQIKRRTGHLKGVKIAVMGCIVNGPGEMADADFGYVGWKPGKVNLYVGKECVVREVPEDDAPDRLVELIKEYGRWCEPAGRPLPIA